MKKIIEIGGYLLGVIGIVLSIYFYELSKKEREPTFIIEPIRTEILHSEKLINMPIRVFKSDNDEIKKDLTVVRFYFWNKGKDPIKAEHLLSKVFISTTGDARIVHHRILKYSRDICELRLEKSDSNRLEINFRILEENDGFTGEVLIEGNSQTQLRIEGTIEGVQAFSNFSVSFYKVLGKTLIYIIAGIFLLGFMFLTMSGGNYDPDYVVFKTYKQYQEDPNFKAATDELEQRHIELDKQRDIIDKILKPNKELPKEPGGHRKNRFKKIIVGVVTVALIGAVYFAWTKAQEDIELNPKNYIPESIRPLQ